MVTFKVGDKVRFKKTESIKTCGGVYPQVFAGAETVVDGVSNIGDMLQVKAPGDNYSGWWMLERFEKIGPRPTVAQLEAKVAELQTALDCEKALRKQAEDLAFKRDAILHELSLVMKKY